MATVEKILAKMQESAQNVSYDDLVKVCKHYFGSWRQDGTSHIIFKMPWQGDPRVNIQQGRDGKAKLYQIKQVLAAIEKLQAAGQEEV
ncbi:toxin HicA [Nocardia sp. NPDC051052]|uniref:toxin HicA n=1 Tax=Nocardia sp. NPDC051052 TaxID=3364322 RepID=UPI003796DA6A